MCWPRSFCCRCPGPSSLPWPPSLAFGRIPRRLSAAPQAPQIGPTLSWPQWTPINPPTLSWPPWSFTAQTPTLPQMSFTPPRSPRKKLQQSKRKPVRRKQVGFVLPPKSIQSPQPPCAPMFMQSPQAWPPPAYLSPELCSPRGAYPYLDWDITHFPSAAKRRTSKYSHTPAVLDGSATFPPTRLLTISFGADNPILMGWQDQWGPIVARAQGAAPGVTVEDVLDAIYKYFNTPLTSADSALMTPMFWNVISDTYYARLKRSPNMKAYDMRRGPLRVDVSGGATTFSVPTKFSGLQQVGRDWLQLALST
ncbi:hypothetical protein C8R43DRAFT_1079952 [Mycena crocata]|nr:hypothetical protein C8R43DRAFT_1079952 [Mycena crocata]